MKTEFDGFYLRNNKFNHIVASGSPKIRQERWQIDTRNDLDDQGFYLRISVGERKWRSEI